MDCCKASNKSEKCVRKRDGKEFTFPRKFTKKQCLTQTIKGFTMKSSCTPWLECGRLSKSKNYQKKKRQFGGYIKNKNKSDKNKNKSDKNKNKSDKNKNKSDKNKNKSDKNKSKPQFLYNPEDPKKSFDVYINKRPNDTIPIKYTTVNDVKNTIQKLEKLYKAKKYSHKRIWQVGMILKVRLEAMKKHKNKLYPNAKNVEQRFNLAMKYFKFLGKRSKQSDKERFAMKFKF